MLQSRVVYVPSKATIFLSLSLGLGLGLCSLNPFRVEASKFDPVVGEMDGWMDHGWMRRATCDVDVSDVPSLIVLEVHSMMPNAS